jgi:hypothetical protein
VEDLSTPTTVTDSSGAELFDVHPMPFTDALLTALDEGHEAPALRGERSRDAAGRDDPAKTRSAWSTGARTVETCRRSESRR